MMDPNSGNVHDLETLQPRTSIATAMQPDPDRFEVTLPSGAKAQILKRGKGKHISLASRMAGGEGGMKLIFGMIAVKALYNGRPLTIEDVEDLPDIDVLELIGHTMSPKMAAEARALLAGEADPKAERS